MVISKKHKIAQKTQLFGTQIVGKIVFLQFTVCALDIDLYLTPLGQARQFIETCGT
jgi:hypothetical protein